MNSPRIEIARKMYNEIIEELKKNVSNGLIFGDPYRHNEWQNIYEIHDEYALL